MYQTIIQLSKFASDFEKKASALHSPGAQGPVGTGRAGGEEEAGVRRRARRARHAAAAGPRHRPEAIDVYLTQRNWVAGSQCILQKLQKIQELSARNRRKKGRFGCLLKDPGPLRVVLLE